MKKIEGLKSELKSERSADKLLTPRKDNQMEFESPERDLKLVRMPQSEKQRPSGGSIIEQGAISGILKLTIHKAVIIKIEGLDSLGMPYLTIKLE